MRREIVSQLHCPEDGASLDLDSGQTEIRSLVLEGSLICRDCGHVFPIADGIADLIVLEGDRSVMAAKKKEIAIRNSEAREIYDWIVGEYRTRLETHYILRQLGNILSEKKLLDLGCGTGRITQALVQRRAEVIGVDYSIQSLREAMMKVGGDGRGLDLLAADITSLPFKSDYFDIVVSSQVLEHLINAKQRELMFKSIRKVLKVGGIAVITTYNYDRVTKRLLGVGTRQGYSSAGVPFYCYDKDELCRDVARFMEVKQIICIEHRIRGGLPQHLGMKIGLWMDEFISFSPFSWKTGHLLLAVCTKS